jgi:hypothetical protein
VPDSADPEVCLIVQAFVPVGLPAAFDLNEAVTDPWISKPPEIACLPAGQVTVNCFSPEAVPLVTVSS